MCLTPFLKSLLESAPCLGSTVVKCFLKVSALKCWILCPPSQGLVSPCLPLSPIVSPHVCLCWMVCPPSRSLVSACLPHCGTCAPVLEGVFAFPRSCLPSVSLHMCACVGWCVCLRKFLSSLVPHCLPMPPIALIASHCLPTCVLVLDGVFAFPRCACVGWCVRIPELLSPLATHCLPLLHMCACGGRCARLPQVRSYPLISLHVSLCFMVYPPSRGLVSPCLPTYVGWCVRFPEVLPPLPPI